MATANTVAMNMFVLLIAILGYFTRSDALRCFDCQDVPYPRECAKVRTCNEHEYCYTEQFVTTSGNIVFTTGCTDEARCSASASNLIGKRSSNISRRSDTDLSTCFECCQDEFCNNKGCGTQDVPIGKRGPYCFNCDTMIDPKTCSEVAICDLNEQCLMYSPPELSGLPETVYKSRCENIAACTVLPTVYTNYKCPPKCCMGDFCNDECGKPSNGSLTTPMPHLTDGPTPSRPPPIVTTQPPITPTQPPVKTTQPPVKTTHSPVITTQPPVFTHGSVQGGCKESHYYDDLTGMCIRIYETNLKTHTDAQAICSSIGDTLVTIDSIEKTVFVENMILRHSSLTDVKSRKYFIGAYDRRNDGHFYWPNGDKMFYTNWGGHDEVIRLQQPDGMRTHPHQRCVIILGVDHYEWHDDVCENKAHFICEDLSFLKVAAAAADHTDHSTHSLQLTQAVTTAPFHCDAHNGYMLMKGGHQSLCVYIHTQGATWGHAQTICKHEGGDLVILDDIDKSNMVRHELSHSRYHNQTAYWVGARDFKHNDEFSWVNGNKVINGDWYKGQPNHHDDGHAQDCVCLWSSTEHYHWHDDYCERTRGFICEKR